MHRLAVKPLVIWRLMDGKPGHEKQTLGLVRHLAALTPVQVFPMAVASRRRCLLGWLSGHFPAGVKLPAPDLIVGAGSGTHPALLAARRARGGRAVVLMRPSLPAALFDLCLIPEHDRPPKRANILVTRGALNAVMPQQATDSGRGLFLIGGISAHFTWDSAVLARQVARICAATPQVQWQLTTSRRTPADFLDALGGDAATNLKVVPHTQTPAGWLEAALAGTGQVWVTEDSVSMLYEALTSGAGVGVLRLAAQAPSRVGRGVQDLIDRQWVTPFDRWEAGSPLPRPPEPFDEAGRCARHILSTWFPERA